MLKRTFYLLNLLKNDQPVTAASLSELLGVSERTVRYDIAELSGYGKENGFELLSLPHYGYVLRITDYVRFEAFRKDHRPEMIPIEPDDRFAYLTNLLLISSQGLSMRQIENGLMISRATASKTMHEVTAKMKKYNIQVALKNGVYAVSGEESNIRICMADMMIRYRLYRYYRNFDIVRLFNVRKKLMELMEEYGIHLPEVSFYHFQIYLFIDLTRSYAGYSLTSYWADEPDECAESLMIGKLSEYIEEKYSIRLHETEKNLLVYRLAGLNMKYEAEAEKTSDDVLQKDLFSVIENAYGIDFTGNKELIKALSSHLHRLEYRIRYHTLLQNPLKYEIRKQFPTAWNMAGFVTERLSVKYGRPVYDEERAYLAIIFQTAIEKTPVKDRKRVLLVSGSTPGIVHYLHKRILDVFGSYIESITCCDNISFQRLEPEKIDLIITTENLNRKTDFPVIIIHRFLDDAGIAKLNAFFQGQKL